jgi:hypothetical protein
MASGRAVRVTMHAVPPAFRRHPHSDDIEQGDSMSETPQARTADDLPYEPPETSTATGWVGMIFFASIMLVLVGVFQFVQGLAALLDDEYFLVTRKGLLLTMDFTVWGWVHVLIGIAAVAASAGILLAKTWARTVAIIVAVVSAIANITFLAAYPVWSILVITLDVLVIYAVAVHGREVVD